jgi:Cdc6-like AAA superfamily ATPase
MATEFDPSDLQEYDRRRALILRAFSPAAPITNHELFAGRSVEMTRVMDVAAQPGRHAAIYGERGVGKTSLARVMSQVLEGQYFPLYYTCSTADTFGSIWAGVLDEAKLVSLRLKAGFVSGYEDIVQSAAELLESDDPKPNDVRLALKALASSKPAIIFIDEFDRIHTPNTRRLFADLLKIISDQAIPATVVLVGVGDTIDELIAEHASIQRSLVQIHMPRMNDDELAKIVRTGVEAAGMQVERVFIRDVTTLSQGLPHYTHLLAQHAALGALLSGRLIIRNFDYNWAIQSALSDTSQWVREAYHRATFSNRETLHKRVLLACALASKDEVGAFSAPDIRDQLRKITGINYELPAFAAHLKDFCSPLGAPRGGILKKSGTARRFRYKFVDPLLPPYAIMKYQVDELVDGPVDGPVDD